MSLPTNEAGQVQYQEIVRLPNQSMPARQVYSQLRAWGEERFPAGNEAELQRDDVHGILFVRSFFPLGNRDVRYTLTLEARIGRYRATLTDLVTQVNGLMVPLQPRPSTEGELARNADSVSIKNKVVEQVAAEQAEFYRQIDKACRDMLANLKTAVTSTK